MASNQETTTFGATIVPTLTNDSDARGKSLEVVDTNTTHPSEPPSRTSTPPACLRTKGSGISDSSMAHNKEATHLVVTPADLEAGLGQPVSKATTQQSTTKLYRGSIDCRTRDSSAWPTKQSLMEKARLAKNKRQCCPWFAALSKKQRMAIKILIALVVIAAATAIGVGISRAVGGGVWTGNNENSDIPN